MKCNLKIGETLGGKWRIESVVGQGAFATVYGVSSVDGPDEKNVHYVAKCIPTGRGLQKKEAKEQLRISNTLNRERDLLAPGKLLSSFGHRPILPNRFYQGLDENAGVNFLILERLDQDLAHWAQSRRTLSEFSNIGLQILEGLQWMHTKTWMFIDLKPENFMLRGNVLVFVDYGLMERFVDQEESGKAVKPFDGTPSYVSLPVHEGSMPCYRDEVESMCLVLLSLISGGKLPWAASTSERECLDLKASTNMMQFAAKYHCEELASIIEHCRSLRYNQKPDYELARNLLLRLGEKKISTAVNDSARSVKSGKNKVKPVIERPVEVEAPAVSQGPALSVPSHQKRKAVVPVETHEPSPNSRATGCRVHPPMEQRRSPGAERTPGPFPYSDDENEEDIEESNDSSARPRSHKQSVEGNDVSLHPIQPIKRGRKLEASVASEATIDVGVRTRSKAKHFVKS